ncbi:hypothetical protein GPROT2_03872 [Gammaproteobacteria bacterium]|nr:hypothetical protein GPROT2_03872 [Gammaproteobacteria bacterium]
MLGLACVPRVVWGARNLAVVVVLFASTAGNPAFAAVVETPVEGTFNRSQENGCIHISLFWYKVDCSYEHAHGELGGQAIPWVGPTVNTVYYALGSPEALISHVPSPADGRIAPVVSGVVTVDPGPPGAPGKAVISAVFEVGPAVRSVATRVGAATKVLRAVEEWRTMTHRLAATRVTSATRNDSGGFDYVIGSRGYPKRICRTKDPGDCYPSAEAALTTDGKWGEGTWQSPGELPVGRSPALGGNVGAVTTAEFSGYQCHDNTGGGECTKGISIWGAGENPGLDNLLLRVTTDSESRVTSIQGFWTQEYRIGVGPPNLQAPAGQDDSWLGGYMELHRSGLN